MNLHNSENIATLKNPEYLEKRQLFWISGIITAAVLGITGCYLRYGQLSPIDGATWVMGGTFLFICGFMGAFPLIGGAHVLWTHTHDSERFCNIAYLHTPIPPPYIRTHEYVWLSTYAFCKQARSQAQAHCSLGYLQGARLLAGGQGWSGQCELWEIIGRHSLFPLSPSPFFPPPPSFFSPPLLLLLLSSLPSIDHLVFHRIPVAKDGIGSVI